MLNIALTGNIAAGKSTVVDFFRQWGATVVDADVLAREAQAPGSAVLALIAARFGADVLTKDGNLDRAGLRAKVMGDDEALAALNQIVHPAVRARRDELQRAAAAHGDLLLVNDIPLLFEALDPALFDRVVLVDAPAAVRRTRLRMLRNLPAEDADRMIAAQMPAERKRARSHFVIENTGTVEDLKAAARVVFEALRREAAVRELSGLDGPVLLAADSVNRESREARAALDALAAAIGDAGLNVQRAAGKAPTLVRRVNEGSPGTVVATPGALPAASAAAIRAGRRPRLLSLESVATEADGGLLLDLRPWGHRHVRLADNPLG